MLSRHETAHGQRLRPAPARQLHPLPERLLRHRGGIPRQEQFIRGQVSMDAARIAVRMFQGAQDSHRNLSSVVLRVGREASHSVKDFSAVQKLRQPFCVNATREEGDGGQVTRFKEG